MEISLRPATSLQKSFWHRCFPENLATFLRNPFLQNISRGCFWNSLQEYINFEAPIGNKISWFIHLYRTQDEFHDFLTNLEMNLDDCFDSNLFLTTVIVTVIYYPLPYEKTIFHYFYANIDHIQQAINLFDWENDFLNTDVDAQASIFSNIISNILNDYIIHETKICDDRHPPWMTTKTKELISQKNELYSRIENRNNSFLNTQLLHSLQQHLSKSMENAKNKYFSWVSEN